VARSSAVSTAVEAALCLTPRAANKNIQRLAGVDRNRRAHNAAGARALATTGGTDRRNPHIRYSLWHSKRLLCARILKDSLITT
jgi:hypothetical protein